MEKQVPVVAETDEEVQMCFDVMSELRTHLKREQFVGVIRGMEAEGYRLVYLKDQGDVVALAGYRIYTSLVMGRNLYVDDLVTSENVRSKGYGETMMRWLQDRAESEGCEFFRLDSGTTRGKAHKFYFNQGLSVGAFHFVQRLV